MIAVDGRQVCHECNIHWLLRISPSKIHYAKIIRQESGVRVYFHVVDFCRTQLYVKINVKINPHTTLRPKNSHHPHANNGTNLVVGVQQFPFTA